jgi:hypothetical protein
MKYLNWESIDRMVKLGEGISARSRLAFTELDRAWFGHYAAVINGTLYDDTDTRDGRLLGYWKR